MPNKPEPAPCACPTPPRHAADCPATADLWPGVAPGTPEPVSLPPCTGEEGFCRGHGFHRHTLERAELPDPLAPFRALADQYAAKADESTRHAKIADDDEKRLTHQGIAAGWRSAEFLLRHTLTDLDNRRTTPDNPPASDDRRRRALARNAVGPALNAHGQWLPLTVREAIADAVLAALDGADDAPATEANDRQPGPPEPASEDAAAHRILTTICETNRYRPPPPGIQITAADLAEIDRMVEHGTPFGEAVRDVIGLAAWRTQQADAVLDQRINDAIHGPTETPS